MRIEIKVPQLAESVTDATLLDWQKREGESVRKGDNLIDLETDKVTLEVTAPESGMLAEIKRQAGDTVVAEEVLAVIDTEAAADAGAPEASPAAAGAQTTATAPEPQPAPAPEPATADGASVPEPRTGPAARKVLAENDLFASEVAGSGGRVGKHDVVTHLRQRDADDPEAEPETPAARPAATAGDRPEERVPMTRLRKRAAERLVEAQSTHAILTTFNEVDMHAVIELRKRYRDQFENEHGVRLGLMSFFVKAAVEALKRFPIVNASVDGTDILYHGYFDIGIAVASPRGLVVPIVRDADRLGFHEVESAVRDFGERAQTGKLTIEELTGGTFTITNGGTFGSLVSTPILNPPQSAILGMHKTEERPVVVDGQIVARPMMYLALSYDHRIIDGREAVQFLVHIKEQLEDPTRMLLGV